MGRKEEEELAILLGFWKLRIFLRPINASSASMKDTFGAPTHRENARLDDYIIRPVTTAKEYEY